MPIVDPRKHINVAMEQMPTYNVENVFNPGNTQSPWSGFASNINTESELRNQLFSLNKDSKNVYVPGSKSDLYKYTFVTNKSGNQFNPHTELFKEEVFEQFNANPNNLGGNIFNNCTRQQVKEMTADSSCSKVKKNPSPTIPNNIKNNIKK